MKKPLKIKIHSDKVEMLPIDRPLPYPKNARSHPTGQIDQLAKLIREQGFTSPILIDSKDVIISGHGRILAAKSLGMTEVPCVRVTNLSQAQMRAMRLTDNKVAEKSNWDLEVLKEEIGALELENSLDLDILGFASFSEELGPTTGEELEEGGRTGSRVNQTIIQFNIVFENEEQQASWFKFMRELKAKYPDLPSLAARLDKFLAKAKV